MPGLHSLYEDFTSAPPDRKVEILRNLISQREKNLALSPTFNRKPRVQSNKLLDIGLTPEEIAVAKKLGIKPKELIALKEQMNG